MVLKLDISKAYDDVDWDFLFSMLEKIGLDETWIKIIRACISSTIFSILANRSLFDFF